MNLSDPLPPPPGFRIGHWTHPRGATGCTVVIAPEGSLAGVDVAGGAPGTRETDVVSPLAGTDSVTAVMLAGGSAYGLAAADGAMRWLERQGQGHATPAGVVPIVPTAIVYDLAEGDPGVRPDADAGAAACEAARAGVPERGRVGAGAGTAAGKGLGRERSTPTGVGYAARRGSFGFTVAALAVANPFGDVLAEDGSVLAGVRAADGEPARRTAELIAQLHREPETVHSGEGNTTLVCLMTDAPLDKAECARVARAGSAGVGRAIDPAFTDVDGDVVFCVASGTERPAGRFPMLQAQTLAVTVVAEAIRDAARSARGGR